MNDADDNGDGDGCQDGAHALQGVGQVVDNGVHDLTVFQNDLNGTGDTDDQSNVCGILRAAGETVHDLIELHAAGDTGQNAANDKHCGHFIQIPTELARADDNGDQDAQQDKQNRLLTTVQRVLIQRLAEAHALGIDFLGHALLGIGLHLLGIQTDNRRNQDSAAEPHDPAQALAGEGGQAHNGIGGADHGCIDGAQGEAAAAAADDDGQTGHDIITKTQADGNCQSHKGNLDFRPDDNAQQGEQEGHQENDGRTGELLVGVHLSQDDANAAFQSAGLADNVETAGGKHDQEDDVARGDHTFGNGTDQSPGCNRIAFNSGVCAGNDDCAAHAFGDRALKAACRKNPGENCCEQCHTEQNNISVRHLLIPFLLFHNTLQMFYFAAPAVTCGVSLTGCACLCEQPVNALLT